jgi:hypothetical protein
MLHSAPRVAAILQGTRILHNTIRNTWIVTAHLHEVLPGMWNLCLKQYSCVFCDCVRTNTGQVSEKTWSYLSKTSNLNFSVILKAASTYFHLTLIPHHELSHYPSSPTFCAPFCSHVLYNAFTRGTSTNVKFVLKQYSGVFCDCVVTNTGEVSMKALRYISLKQVQ